MNEYRFLMRNPSFIYVYGDPVYSKELLTDEEVTNMLINHGHSLRSAEMWVRDYTYTFRGICRIRSDQAYLLS